jgi:hypothetical protein
MAENVGDEPSMAMLYAVACRERDAWRKAAYDALELAEQIKDALAKANTMLEAMTHGSNN